MDYRFAIPSYNRPTKQHTFKYLLSLGVNPLDIDIFVADAEQAELYKTHNPEMEHIIIGKLGMMNIRNFITDYYPQGTKYVSMDDDIKYIKMKNPKEWEESSFADEEVYTEGWLDKEIKLAFKECENSGRKMFGCYPVNNHYFMKNNLTYDFKFIGGWFWGCINDKDIQININQYEDYDRCIQQYLKYGGVVRLNYLCCQLGAFGAEGGMGKEREYQADIDNLLSLYPGLVKTKFKQGRLNPVLTDTRPKTTIPHTNYN
jgi:hypothetical protein